jgi:adenosine deaminase CECR1
LLKRPMTSMTALLLAGFTVALMSMATMQPAAAADPHWFEQMKVDASDAELYQLLFEMPKGGDLHEHLTGSGLAEWWFDEALASVAHGYVYYTKVKINNCREYGAETLPGTAPYYLMFTNVTKARWQNLSACEQGEYMRLSDLAPEVRAAWENSIRLDKPTEGRDEFFEAHWSRLGDMSTNPWLVAELLYHNIQSFSEEGLIYMEPQLITQGYTMPDGALIPEAQVAEIFRQRLSAKDVLATGMIVRFQQSLLRFAPNAEEQLREMYKLVAENDLYVAVNMVGREDNDKGYPLRFLSTLRELRHQYHSVKLSIHAGEVDEPNSHISDTLLLGADRIGHGVNLITDPDTMRLMRHGPYMVEINLVSNLLLEYVDDYAQHPFPEYLRIGIPVALSTDDRGMWDSTMTDEFYVAVREFNLSWDEVKLLSRNSLTYSFVEDDVKQQLLETYEDRISAFEARLAKRGLKALRNKNAPKRRFICTRYGLCE